MKKTNAVAYYSYKISHSNKSILLKEINEAPLKNKEIQFLLNIIEGDSYRELSQKWHISESRVAKWKRSLFEKMQQYDLRQIKPKAL